MRAHRTAAEKEDAEERARARRRRRRMPRSERVGRPRARGGAAAAGRRGARRGRVGRRGSDMVAPAMRRRVPGAATPLGGVRGPSWRRWRCRPSRTARRRGARRPSGAAITSRGGDPGGGARYPSGTKTFEMFGATEATRRTCGVGEAARDRRSPPVVPLAGRHARGAPPLILRKETARGRRGRPAKAAVGGKLEEQAGAGSGAACAEIVGLRWRRSGGPDVWRDRGSASAPGRGAGSARGVLRQACRCPASGHAGAGPPSQRSE